MFKWSNPGASLLPIILMLMLAACAAPTDTGAPGTPVTPAASPTPSAPPPEAQTPTVGAEPTETIEATQTETALPTEMPVPPTEETMEVAEPTATVAGPGSEEPGSPPVDLTNPFPKILGPAPAPEGWTVQPCEGDGPFLCVLKGADNIGFVHLSTYPLETMTDFQRMLSDAGVDAESFDYKDPEDAGKARQALRAFVENYHSTIMQDREATFGDTKTYKRLPTQEINVGELPGLRYGLVLLNQDGSVYERWLSYSTFDGEGLFTIVASFYPNPELSFRSDEELQQFEPFLVEIIEGLKLPHPEVRGDKTRG